MNTATWITVRLLAPFWWATGLLALAVLRDQRLRECCHAGHTERSSRPGSKVTRVIQRSTLRQCRLGTLWP
jgi:hypothetical protein